MIFFNSLFFNGVQIFPNTSHDISLTTSGVHTFFLHDDSADSYTSTIIITSEAENIELTVTGRIYARNNAIKKLTINIILQGKKQSAQLDLKAIGDDSSFISFSGGVTITEKSSFCQAQVHEKVVLISPNAKAKVIPILRVETQNVEKASHSASIAPFSEELFFFLATRGIATAEAKQLLATGMLGIQKIV